MTDAVPHFVLVPMMAQGHTIPMLDMARLLASRGAAVSFVTTPANAARIASFIDRISQLGLPVNFIILNFPCAEVGLPEGCENVDTLPSKDLLENFLNGAALLRDPLIARLREPQLSPSCLINDSGHTWTREVAKEFGVPRLTFNGFGCFALLLRYLVFYEQQMFEGKEDDEFVVVPGLPHRIEITKEHSPVFVSAPWYDKFRAVFMQVDSESDGVVVNSSDDLEPSYKEWYEKTINKKVYTIGPMSLSITDPADVAIRGNKSCEESDYVLDWLESMKPSSVLYVSFGSLARITVPQLIEIGLGLEASHHNFIWVIKAGDKMGEIDKWLSSGFSERIKERGVVIKGWVPQVTILSHPAVGGFMTHCGWNSTMEGAVAGVPMVTWPHFADQFLNERVIVDVLGVGVAVGVKRPTKWGVEGEEVVMVDRGDVEKAVRSLMDDTEEAKERRTKVRELGVKAKAAMEEGGSSYNNLKELIQFAKVKVHATKG